MANNRIVQRVLSEKKWTDLLISSDFRVLTPLFYTHPPYVNFNFDMNERIDIENTIS